MNSGQRLESNHGFKTNLYYVCCILCFSQERSVHGKPTQASEIQNEEDDLMARAGGSRWMTRVIFKFLRFQTVDMPSSVGQRVGSQGLRGRARVRTTLRPILVFLYKTHDFLIIFIILIFLHHFNYFHSFYFASKKIPKIFFFLHYFHKNAYLI